MENLLFIGGPADGLRIDVYEGQPVYCYHPVLGPVADVRVEVDPHAEYAIVCYKREVFYTGTQKFYFMVLECLQPNDWLERLLKGYRPITLENDRE